MTMYGASWGLNLVGVTPLAKLVAVRLGDGCDVTGYGGTSLRALAEWCCAEVVEVRGALDLLASRAGVQFNVGDDLIEYYLPAEAQPTRRENLPGPEGTMTLYVMTGRAGVKVGITTEIHQRVAGIRLATLDDSIQAVWTDKAPASVIRKAERLAHLALSSKLYRNEWFTCTEQEAIEACRNAIAEAKINKT